MDRSTQNWIVALRRRLNAFRPPYLPNMRHSIFGVGNGREGDERFLDQSHMDARDLRRRLILSPTPRERWHPLWLLSQGWTASAAAQALERDPHTIGPWHSAFNEGGVRALIFEQTGGSSRAQRGAASGVVGSGAGTTSCAGIGMANWIWRMVQQFAARRYGIGLSRNSCLNYLHRLGFVLKWPKKRLVKADERKRESFVAEYADLVDGARRFGAKIFFADEAHFRADAELRSERVLKGEPTLVDPSSSRDGEKASYYSAVCLETGEVERMELEGNSNAETSAAFLRQLIERHVEPLNVIWDNAPAHRGEAVRAHLATPELRLRPVNLHSYSPNFNADEAIWGWVRQEVAANLCLGTKAEVQGKVGDLFARLADRREEVKPNAGPSSKHGRKN